MHDFPRPQWPAIQDVESVDIVGVRRDGGIELVIVASQPIDDSAETLDTLRQKIATYLTAAASPAFFADMDHITPQYVAIVLNCPYPIHPAARAEILTLARAVTEQGL